MLYEVLFKLSFAVIAWVFLFSTIYKLLDLQLNIYSVHKALNISVSTSRLCIYLIIFFEVAVLSLLSIGMPFAGIALSILLLGLFSMFLFWTIVKKVTFYCSCFGKTHEKVGMLDLLRNGIFIVIAMFCLFELNSGLTYNVDIIESVFIAFSSLVITLTIISTKSIVNFLRD